MDTMLFQVRVKAFIYELLTIVLTAAGGWLLSPEFQELVSRHFDETVFASLILLVVSAVVKHLRNVMLVGKDKRLAAEGKQGEPFMLI